MHFISSRHSKPLTRQEEAEIAQKAYAGDKASIHRLITSHYRFAVALAKQYRGRGVELEDLVSEACMGLQRAAEGYDPATGNRFMSYAVWWVRRYCLAAIHSHGGIVRLPQTFHQSDRTKPKAQKEEHAEAIRRVLFSPSFEAMQEGGWDLEGGECPARRAAERSDAKWIADLISGLEPEDQIIIRDRFAEPPATLGMLAERMGISRERVRQREKAALKTLRKRAMFHRKLS